MSADLQTTIEEIADKAYWQGFRAGIEAAAKIADRYKQPWVADEIRALAQPSNGKKG